MRTLDVIAWVLIVIGALNWGLVGFFEYDLVASMFGGQDAAGSRVVYSLVGLAGLYELFSIRAMQRRWARPEPPARPVHA